MKKEFIMIRNRNYQCSFFQLVLTLCLIALPGFSGAQAPDTIVPAGELKKLSLEELMNVEIEVFSVSKRAEKLTEVASAIQVITAEDIRRSGASNLPEALRMATNLQVAQLNSYAWIIGTRGFNALFSNKLLVMIDGRTVYSPLFAGVFWDVQNVLLEDINRIEVVSGPGGTLWGANAVNGVINIITKNAKDTPGLYVSAAGGTQLKNFGAVRYGGNIGSKFSYRIYAQRHDYNSTYLPNGRDNTDRWGLTQTGFRTDWNPSDGNALLVQGNFYKGKELTFPDTSDIDGQNILGRWTRTFSEKSDLIIQVYVDRTWRRDIPSTISDQLTTYDFDLQYRFPIGKAHNIMWGTGYRFMHDEAQHSTVFVGFLPPTKDLDLVSFFLQDEIRLLSQFKLTLGTKLQRNDYSGFELQPSARLAWTTRNEKQTIWSAVSRAVRTPSRIDVDYFIPTYPVAPGTPNVAGGPNFKSETVIAYELGYRVQPTPKLFFSLATFYNQYDDLYSVEALPGTLTYQIMNGIKGYSYGAEFSGTYQVLKSWRLRGGYNYFLKELKNKPNHNFDPASLGNDPQHSFFLQSITNLPGNFQMDIIPRFVSARPNPYVSEYFTFDARLAWTFLKLEVSVVGQNLWEERHLEIGSEIPRSVYGKFAFRF